MYSQLHRRQHVGLGGPRLRPLGLSGPRLQRRVRKPPAAATARERQSPATARESRSPSVSGVSRGWDVQLGLAGTHRRHTVWVPLSAAAVSSARWSRLSPASPLPLLSSPARAAQTRGAGACAQLPGEKCWRSGRWVGRS